MLECHEIKRQMNLWSCGISTEDLRTNNQWSHSTENTAIRKCKGSHQLQSTGQAERRNDWGISGRRQLEVMHWALLYILKSRAGYNHDHSNYCSTQLSSAFLWSAFLLLWSSHLEKEQQLNTTGDWKIERSCRASEQRWTTPTKNLVLLHFIPVLKQKAKSTEAALISSTAITEEALAFLGAFMASSLMRGL